MNIPRKYALLGAIVLAFGWTIVLAQQTAKKFTGSSYGDIHYLEHLPNDYNTSSKQYPLIIFLHGSGEQGPADGTLIDKVKRQGPPKFIEAGDDMTFTVNGQTFSFIVISPQLQYNVGAWPNEYIDAVVQATLSRYRIDRSRIYLTGLSLGGGGTWRYGAQEADFLAAIAPLAGTQSPNRGFAGNIAAENLPVWIFHGGNDSSPPSAQASTWAQYLNEAGADPAPKVTIYPGLGHESAVWDKAYRTDNQVHTPNLYEWFLQHQRGNTTPPPPANQPPVARAGADVTIQLPTSQVKLSGSASSDSDGSIVTYAWTKTSGPNGTSLSGQATSQLTVNGLTLGSYTFQLQVTDNQGATSTDEVRVVVQALTADCGCDYVVPAGQHVTDGASLNIQPGDVICLQADTSYGNLKFTNLQGTADNPIIIRNCGGQVTINTAATFVLKTENSRHFRITGSGEANHEYGIVLRGATSLGLTLDALSTEFEVDHLEVSNVGFAGIMAKTDPTCGKPYDRSKFTMRNINIHHNYVHDTGGEGLYIGNSFYANGINLPCGKLYPHAILNAKIHHNTIKRTDWDGIQVGSATQGCEVYNNVVEDAGLKMSGTHGNGIQLGEGTGGKCYNNIIKNSYANGMIVLGLGDNVIFNNIIINSGGQGAFIDSRPPASPGNGFKFINNTIVGVGASENGVRIYAQLSNLQNVVKNNIIVGPAVPVKLLHNGVTNVEVSNNLSVSNASGAGFVDAGAGNYQLTASSPAVNAGSNVSQYGIVNDFKGTPRPQGSAYDIGAYEFQAPSSPVSLWLEAECGSVGSSWQTITDATASNGKYVMYPQGNVSKNPPSGNPSDQVTFTVNVSQAASYFLLARIKAIDNARNSFWIKIDNRSWIEWWEGMTLSQSFAWNLAPGGAFALSAGSHTISFAYREGGTQLDKLVLSTAKTLPSGLGGTAPSCTATPPPPASVVTVDAGVDKTVSPDTTLNLSPASLQGPNPFRAYLWEKVSGPSVTLTARGANATLTNLQVGSYEFKFTATDSEGNSGSDRVKVFVTGSNARTADSSPKPTVERTPDALASVLVYPNPVDGSLKVSLGTEQQASLSLSDLSGRMLYRQLVTPSSTGQITISTDAFPEGMYLLRVERQDQVQLTKVLIKH